MATFEEEALKRAKQMQNKSNNNFYQQEKNRTKPSFETVESEKKTQNIEFEEIVEKSQELPLQNSSLKNQHGTLDFLLADKEQSLVLLLLLLLTGENADPALLLALMYLLI